MSVHSRITNTKSTKELAKVNKKKYNLYRKLYYTLKSDSFNNKHYKEELDSAFKLILLMCDTEKRTDSNLHELKSHIWNTTFNTKGIKESNILFDLFIYISEFLSKVFK